jgi:hypothetical protein
MSFSRHMNGDRGITVKYPWLSLEEKRNGIPKKKLSLFIDIFFTAEIMPLLLYPAWIYLPRASRTMPRIPAMNTAGTAGEGNSGTGTGSLLGFGITGGLSGQVPPPLSDVPSPESPRVCPVPEPPWPDSDNDCPPGASPGGEGRGQLGSPASGSSPRMICQSYEPKSANGRTVRALMIMTSAIVNMTGLRFMVFCPPFRFSCDPRRSPDPLRSGKRRASCIKYSCNAPTQCDHKLY